MMVEADLLCPPDVAEVVPFEARPLGTFQRFGVNCGIPAAPCRFALLRIWPNCRMPSIL